VIDECPYTIEYAYSDNGKEYKGTVHHSFVKTCIEYGIGQKFTRVNRPQTNGKAERVIRTLMEMWHQKETFSSRQTRRISLNRFINFYNVVKPHKGIDNMTPYEKLTGYFYPETVNNAL
jgi:transposase InsO family protein